MSNSNQTPGGLSQFSPQRSIEGTLQMVSREIAFRDETRKDRPFPYIHLLSPDGSSWRLSISDAGALSAIKVQGT
jgi:hypothetical protein